MVEVILATEEKKEEVKMWLVMHKIGLLVSDHGAAMLVFDPVLDSL